MKKIITIAVIFLCHSYLFAQQGLLINGSAEYYDTTTLVPENWTIITGNWKSQDHTGFTAAAHDSTHIFYEGMDPIGVLQQDVNVSGYAATIDDSAQDFLLSAWVQSRSEAAPADQTAIALQGFDAANSQITYSWHSDTLSSTGAWTQVIKHFTAPPGTRHIHVQLIAIRNQGTENDGYFDDIQLVPVASTRVSSIVNNEVFTATPNPASSFLHIMLKTPGHYHVNIIGMDGKIALATGVTQSGDIDVSTLPLGTYSLQVFSENGVSFQTSPFVKH